MEEPITEWIEQLRCGDEQAAAQLWGHFSDRLRLLARKRLSAGTRRVYDEDDLAQSAFLSLCRGITDGRFPNLADRTGLDKLMMTITTRKIAIRIRYDLREKRDIRRALGESDMANGPGSDTAAEGTELQTAPGSELAPDLQAELADTCDELFAVLDSEELQAVALLRFEGYTTPEIAARLGCTRRTVERKMERIRRRWQALLDTQSNSDES